MPPRPFKSSRPSTVEIYCVIAHTYFNLTTEVNSWVSRLMMCALQPTYNLFWARLIKKFQGKQRSYMNTIIPWKSNGQQKCTCLCIVFFLCGTACSDIYQATWKDEKEERTLRTNYFSGARRLINATDHSSSREATNRWAVQKFRAFYGITRYLTVFTGSYHRTPPPMGQSTYSHTIIENPF
jgi:hypothetical protein